MPTYLHPGVYIEEIPSGVKPIEGVGTSTAAFVGFTTKGPIGEAQLLLKRDDYTDHYGGLQDLGAGAIGDRMGLAVSAFFQNGGTKAYVVRLAASSGAAGSLASASVNIRSPLNDADSLTFEAVNEGEWANGLRVDLVPSASDPTLLTVTVGREDSQGNLVVNESFARVSLDDTSPRFIESVVNDGSALVTATFNAAFNAGTAPTSPEPYLTGTSTSGDLSGANLDFSGIAPAGDRQLRIALDGQPTFDIEIPATDFSGDLAGLAAQIQTLVRTGAANARRTEFTAEVSQLRLVLTSGSRATASAAVVTPGHGLAATLQLGVGNGGTEVTAAQQLALGAHNELAGGDDGEAAGLADYQATFTSFEKIRDINVILLPDHAWDAAGRPFLEAAVAHAERMRNRMVLIDPPQGTELVTDADVTGLQLPTSTYTVAYYPWVKVANPFFDAEDNPGVPATLLAPPGGYAAGMWSKIDGKRGVWKAPAGLEARLLGLAGLEYQVEDGEQDQLNPLGVNAYRVQPGFGSVIWGARTLSTRADPEWRYVPVRRTALFIEQSIYNGIQWAVFEPNDHNLWSSLRINVGSFMDGLFRASAFQGAKATDAYFVRCGLGDTMTQGDIDRGQVIVIVGFAPLKPAEFVIVRIQQKVAQQ